MAGLEEHVDELADAGIRIVTLSADDEEGAREMKEDESLSFPVLYGLDVDEMERRLRLYVNRGGRTHLQPAQFLLDEEGTIELACYSSGKVGRLDASDVLRIMT